MEFDFKTIEEMVKSYESLGGFLCRASYTPVSEMDTEDLQREIAEILEQDEGFIERVLRRREARRDGSSYYPDPASIVMR